MPLLLKRKNHTARYFREKLSDDVHLDMMLIPGGMFSMGSPETEKDRSPFESPQHRVTVQAFCMGKYPITQAQWQAVADQNSVLKPNPSEFTGDDLPVENISWNDATEFCAALSELTGREYRLPTEAEWEYACRAKTTTPFHFGETITTDLANYNGMDYEDSKWPGSYGDGPKGTHRRETTIASAFPPNVFGLHDMHGNVWEWCQDNWHSDYIGAPIDGSSWANKSNNDSHLLRSGSWTNDPQFCRSAFRGYRNSEARDKDVGVRVVCEAARTL
jgi:formylglycine-generating enzyme required for sulfatase activity